MAARGQSRPRHATPSDGQEPSTQRTACKCVCFVSSIVVWCACVWCALCAALAWYAAPLGIAGGGDGPMIVWPAAAAA